MLIAMDYAVLSLCYDYLQQTQKKAITYDSLIAYIRRNKKSAYRDETITRTLRKLAEAGYFERKYVSSYNNPRSKIVLYIPTSKFNEFFQKQNQKSVRA